MVTASRDFRYCVEFNIHAIDAPGTRLTKQGDIYLNICLLGVHKRTRLMPPHLPMHVDQKLFFEKVFKFCVEPEDIIERLAREHVLIELIQNDFPSPILLASYETLAKDFLYPYTWDRIEHVGLRRYILLNRTIDFPGISPSLEFSTSPTVDDITGLSLEIRSRQNRKNRPLSPTWRPTSSTIYRTSSNTDAVGAHTISSALKSDHRQTPIKEKLRELAVDHDVRYVVPADKTGGRPPFVVRRVDSKLIDRKPKSHTVMSDGVVVDDYTLARPVSAIPTSTLQAELTRSRPVSPLLGRSIQISRARTRSPSPTRRSSKLARSVELDRSLSPTRSLHNSYDDDVLSRSLTRLSLSPTLYQDSFRSRYRYSPATDLSDKVIQTLQRNLDSYNLPLYYGPYSWYWYERDLLDAEILARRRRLADLY